MVQSLDRSQGRSGGIAAGASDKPTFTGNRALQIEEPLIFEMGQPGRCGVDLPEPPKVKDRLNGLKRAGEIGLPGLSEPQVVQHYTRLSQKNYAIDMGVYPLGSCTMKHNPRINEKVARLLGIGDLHPLQPVSTVQGALELIDRLAHWLKTLTGRRVASGTNWLMTPATSVPWPLPPARSSLPAPPVNRLVPGATCPWNCGTAASIPESTTATAVCWPWKGTPRVRRSPRPTCSPAVE